MSLVAFVPPAARLRGHESDRRDGATRDRASGLLAARRRRATYNARTGVGIHDARAFLERGAERALRLAAALGLTSTVAPATDPFFAPTGRAKQLLQRIKE